MSATEWKAPANEIESEPDAWERKCGRFVLCAWPDGFWAIDFGRGRGSHRLRECRPGENLDSLENAQGTAEAVFRNLLAEAIGDFGEQP